MKRTFDHKELFLMAIIVFIGSWTIAGVLQTQSEPSAWGVIALLMLPLSLILFGMALAAYISSKRKPKGTPN